MALQENVKKKKKPTYLELQEQMTKVAQIS
jgi:hypothetical protein